MEGNSVDYVPGWDCHGLPIELKATQEDVDLSPLQIRSKARNLALDAIERQKSSFKQWFLMVNGGKFKQTYCTMNTDYVINELKAFYRLYEQDLIFRDVMPVYFSPSTKTALAEAELQYNPDHVSSCAYVKYPLLNWEFPVSALIWTTTPWTLLANEAISYSDSLSYSVVQLDQKPEVGLLLIATDTIAVLSEKFQSNIKIIHKISTDQLASSKYSDPLDDNQAKPFLVSNHVTGNKGTGLVHTAPNHGYDDYKLCLKHGHQYRKQCIVDGDGQVNGHSIIDDNSASKHVLAQLGPMLVHQEQLTHSYPYDWRTNKPVIIRPSAQWFLNIDSIRSNCIQALDSVTIYPEKLRKEIINQLATRPNWCLSRQRKWGVPIPAFYHKNDVVKINPIIDEDIFESILTKITDNGCDVWWSSDPQSLLQDSNFDSSDLVKGEDILDIWFDSGVSWLSVLPLESGQVADMYLEGVDQIRGWFQSSLITSVALRGIAPYRSLFIHGFALDQEGKKMSKSVGNVVDPMDIINSNLDRYRNDSLPSKKSTKSTKNTSNCGLSGLRLWIAQHACTHNDVNVDLKDFQEDILTILNRFRNTYRFMLGYLTKRCSTGNDLSTIEYDRIRVLDKYILMKLWQYNLDCNQNYSDHNLSDLVEKSIRLIVHDVGTFYLSRIKDRLYCEPYDSVQVQSVLTTLWHVYHTVAYQLAPIIPHFALEVNSILPLSRQAIFMPSNDSSQLVNILFEANDDRRPSSVACFQDRMSSILMLIDVLNKWSTSEQNVKLSEYDCYLTVKDRALLDDLKVSWFMSLSQN